MKIVDQIKTVSEVGSDISGEAGKLGDKFLPDPYKGKVNDATSKVSAGLDGTGKVAGSVSNIIGDSMAPA
jgi:hypothetical protein